MFNNFIYKMKLHKTLKTLAQEQPLMGNNCIIEKQIAKNIWRVSQLKSNSMLIPWIITYVNGEILKL